MVALFPPSCTSTAGAEIELLISCTILLFRVGSPQRVRGETSAEFRFPTPNGKAHQRKNRLSRSMVGDAHPTKIALLQLVQDVRLPSQTVKNLVFQAF